jgi:phosphomannomutase
MCGTQVLDKDGVSAAMVAMEMASYLYHQGTTLKKQLDNLHQMYCFLFIM